MTVSWTDSSQIRITRLKLGLCHKVWFWSSPFHSSACLSWRLFLPLFDPCYPDIPVFSLSLTVFQGLVSQALGRIIVFHASYSIFCFLWYDRSGLLIYVPDNDRFILWNALPLLSTLYFTSHGIASAIFTHLFSGFMWSPIGWLKSRKLLCVLSVYLYIIFRSINGIFLLKTARKKI